jgi:biotin carboxylase
MTRTLLVDTNRAAYPIYQALCDLGHEVSVVGSKASETLSKLSPNYITLDYSDADRLSALVADYNFDYVVPGCTDVSYSVCAAIAKGRFHGLDTPEITQQINNKAEFRQLAREVGLYVPRVLSESEAAAATSIIVKPTDAFSGRGIQVLRDPTPQEVQSALASARAASGTGQALVEEFVSGQLHSHSAFIRNRKIVADFFVREDCAASPFAVDVSCLTQDISINMQSELRGQVELLSERLNLVDGLVHTQFVANKEQFWIVEITRRCPGDLYSLLVEFSTGYPYAASYAAPFVARTAESKASSVNFRDWIIRHTVTARRGATLWGLRFHRSVDIRLWIPLATAGDSLAPSPAGRAAIIFFRAASKDEHDSLYEALLAGTLYSFD